MEIRSPKGTGSDDLYTAFARAFADYELQLDRQQLTAMLRRRGYDPALSFAAFENGEIVAFTLNGSGTFNGIPSAYDTGTGTVPEHRGKGLASEIFEFSIPHLREKGIRQYVLEVLQHNTTAVKIYKNLGFEVSREFDYYRQSNENVRCRSHKAGNFHINDIEIKEIAKYVDFHDFVPSWQNGFESIARSGDDLIALGSYADGRVVGYGVFEPASGDVAQLAVDRHHRRKGIAGMLLSEMVNRNRYGTVKVINTEATCAAIGYFLQAMNIKKQGMQYEMVKRL